MTGWGVGGWGFPATPPPPFATPSSMVVVVVVVMMVRRFLFHGLLCGARDIRVDLGDAADGFGPALSEHHACVGTDVLGVLDEPEATAGLVPCPQVLPVHGDNGGCLSGTATMNCIVKHKMNTDLHNNLYSFRSTTP